MLFLAHNNVLFHGTILLHRVMGVMHTGKIWPILFVIATLVPLLLVSKLQYPDRFTTPNDPYFHAAYATQLAIGNVSPNLPYTSTISWFDGGSLYFLYHESLAQLIRFTGSTNDATRIILLSKLFHAFLALLVFTAFLRLSYRIARTYRENQREAWLAATFLSVLLLLTMQPFVVRLLYERPHILAIALILCIVNALFSRTYVHAGVLCLVLAMSYNFAVILAVPVAAYLLAEIVVHRGRWLRRCGAALGASVVGFVLGVLLLPNSLHYVYNGVIVHFHTLWFALFGSIISPDEISRIPLTTSLLFYYFLMGTVCIHILYALIHRRSISTNHIFLAILSAMFMVLSLAYMRAIEYFAPLALVSLFIFVLHINSKYGRNFREFASIHLNNGQKRFIKYSSVVTIALLSLYTPAYLLHTSSIINKAPVELQAFLKDVDNNTEAGEKVHVPRFGSFPFSYFYVPKLQYSQGMDPAFLYLASTENYWINHHLFYGSKYICAHQHCVNSTHTPYEVVTNNFDATVVLGWCMRKVPSMPCTDENVKNILENDNRLSLIAYASSTGFFGYAYRVLVK